MVANQNRIFIVKSGEHSILHCHLRYMQARNFANLCLISKAIY